MTSSSDSVDTSQARATIRQGLKAVTPFMLGMIPFGLVAGVSAVDAGRSSLDAVYASVVVFSGIVQVPALQLYGAGVPSITIVLITATISLRFVMYSLSIAPHFKAFSKPWRAPMAYVMTDPSYALSMHYFAEHPNSPYKFHYYAAVAVPLWFMWQLTTYLGALLGQQIPTTWSVDFVVPLVFTALLFASLRNRNQYLTALVAAVTALVAYPLPYGLGLLVAAFVGIVTGYLLESFFPGERA
jgi:4-azaleucine resistance transporter AzlC